ncbi:hypothetical protein Bbelb_115500 [Branchiostoma belcheri]|nr:hypothetical protein Bbelb_115500 [Branchiostoma belcheri]
MSGPSKTNEEVCATVTTRRTCFCVLSTCKNFGKRRTSVRVEYRLLTDPESYGFGSTQTRRRTLSACKTFSTCGLRIHHPCVRVRATLVPRTYRTEEAHVNVVHVTGREWFVSRIRGSDVEGCLDRKLPCLTIRHALRKAENGDVINVEPTHTADDVYDECVSSPMVISKNLTLRALQWENQSFNTNSRVTKHAVVDCRNGKVAFDISSRSDGSGPCKVRFIGFVFQNVTTAVNVTDMSLDIVSSTFRCVRNESVEVFPNWKYCIHIYGSNNSSVFVTIRDSEFAHMNVGALKVSDTKYLELSNVKFSSSSPKYSPSYERNCSFLNHPATVFNVQRKSDYIMPAAGVESEINITNSLFTFIQGDLRLDQCKLERHQSHIHVEKSKITFSNCTFIKKTDFNRVLHLQGADTIVTGCTFDSKEARGGNLIYSTGGLLLLEDTSITSANCSQKNIGDVLYTIGPGRLEMVNTVITVSYNTPGNLILVAWNMDIMTWEGSSLVCPLGYSTESLTSRGSDRNWEKTQFVSCIPCPSGRYSVDSGFYAGGALNASNATLPCQECPYGAQCDGYTVSALPNFWGTVVRGTTPKQIEMVLCPTGYCCEEAPCESFNTCSNNRTGTMCGECLDGFTRQLYSVRCVPVEDCRHKDFWISVAIVSFSLGTLFILYLMGYGIPACCKKIFKKNNKKHRVAYGPVHIDISSNSAWSRFTRECAVAPKGAFLFSVFYFYQTLSLLVEGDRYDLVVGDLDSWVRSVLLFFNLRIPYSPSILCPFVDMTADEKILLELLLYVAILYAILLLLIVVLYTSTQLCCGRKSSMRDAHGEEIPFKYRVARAATSIASLSQTNIALSCFSLLHCIDLDNHKVFYYNGNEPCDALRWWQIVAVVVLIVHTVPFILAILLRPFCQRRFGTGLGGVLLAYHFPVGFIGFMFVKAVCSNRPQSLVDPRSQEGLKFVTNYVDSAYETTSDENTHVNPKCAFEAANFLLRFLIITMNIFTNWSPVTRAVGNFLLITLYLVLVFFISPYGSAVLNISAKICLVVLNFIAGSQIMYAGFHQAGFVWTRPGLPFYPVSLLLGQTTMALQIGGPLVMVMVVAVGWLFHSGTNVDAEPSSFASDGTERSELMMSCLSSVNVTRAYRETSPLVTRILGNRGRRSIFTDVSHNIAGNNRPNNGYKRGRGDVNNPGCRFTYMSVARILNGGGGSSHCPRDQRTP